MINTVHASAGSEYTNVLLIHSRNLDRTSKDGSVVSNDSLNEEYHYVYTALTRASERMVVLNIMDAQQDKQKIMQT